MFSSCHRFCFCKLVIVLPTHCYGFNSFFHFYILLSIMNTDRDSQQCKRAIAYNSSYYGSMKNGARVTRVQYFPQFAILFSFSFLCSRQSESRCFARENAFKCIRFRSNEKNKLIRLRSSVGFSPTTKITTFFFLLTMVYSVL